MKTSTERVCQQDPELWFSQNARDKREAIKLCGTCIFQTACAEDGKEQEFGIWGGIDMHTSGSAVAIRKETNEETYAQIMDLWNGPEKITKTEIGQRVGISRNTVTDIIARFTTVAA